MKIIIKNNKIDWTLPSYSEESEEFNRYSFSEKEKQEILNQFKEENLISLKDDIWKKLQNTDSWDSTNLEDVERLATEYGKDFRSILKAFKSGNKIPSPIILLKNNHYELIAGNTRLMLSRALGKRPKVLLIKLGENK